MLIKSLDSRVVINTDTMTCMYIDKREKTIYCTITHSEDEIGCILGKFESEEKTQAIFDELCALINNGRSFAAVEKDGIKCIR